jgi:hypothetical protein
MQASRKTWVLSCVIGLAVLTLVACGPDRSQSRRAHAGSGAGAGVASPGAADDADLNAAVSLSPAPTLFGLKFKLATGPVVGQPATVDLVVIPTGSVAFDRVHLSLRPGDGLRLLSDNSLDTTDTTAGEPIRYEVTLVPDAAGVLTLSVTLVVDAESSSLTRTYTIPLIAVPAAG